LRSTRVRVPGEQSMVALLGPGDELLRMVEDALESLEGEQAEASAD
jgi:hypothetical protein